MAGLALWCNSAHLQLIELLLGLSAAMALHLPLPKRNQGPEPFSGLAEATKLVCES